ncbi:MAG: hypothetical protein AB7P07_07855 [Hyphomonadaceae bacterium]
MKFFTASALALSLAVSSVAAPAAFASEQTQFRSVEAQTFSTADLQRYGLSADDATQVAAYQDQGYQVQVITQEEAEQQYAGQFSDSQWLVIGLIVVVVVVAVAVGD